MQAPFPRNPPCFIFTLPVVRCKQLYGGDTKQMWKDFNAMQNALRNARGQSVGEAMHEAVTVTPETSIITAANRIVCLIPVHNKFV